jgi:monovalent cation/hydrogen antiporter
MANECEHLEGLTARDFPAPHTPGACEECLAAGTFWVALRECRQCGHVGCCDSSPGKHATRHFEATQHPVMRSVTGDAWTWCYLHEAKGRLEGQ